MKRRSFLQILGLVPFVGGILAAKEKFGPSKQDVALSKLAEIGDYGTTSSPFIWHRAMWFFSDRNIIKFQPDDDLSIDEDSSPDEKGKWETIQLMQFEEFDFWLHEKGRLFWCGRREKWEVIVLDGCFVKFQFTSFFDEDEK
jgi:hypothetical protein